MAQLYGKHVFAFGQAHYICEGINSSVKTASEVAELITNDNFSFNKDKSLRFISYLINDFYSFATWIRSERKHTEKANLSISLNIEYKSVRVINEGTYSFEKEEVIDIRESILFDRYRLDEYISRKPTATQPAKPNILPDVSVTTSSKVDKAEIKVIKDVKNKSKLSRKFKKLATNPRLFFRDALRNRVN